MNMSSPTISDDARRKGVDLAGWLQLAADITAVAEAVAGTASAERSSGPQIVGLAVLARSIGHMRAVSLLIKAELTVEARTITRSLFENMFLAVALSEDGVGTLKDLEADHHASRSKRGKLIAEDTSSFSPAQIIEVRAHLEQLGKGKILVPRNLAENTSVGQAYLFYAQLSGDSAHPSLDALERHVVKDVSGRLLELALEPVGDPDEPQDTVGLACMALLGILFAIRDLLGLTEVSAQIDAVSRAYLRKEGQLPSDTP
ncbi:MAG: hypothetical protein ING10_04005 [Roseomonas sp.]|nr:hypothetical protein [Roseomonas sp.]